MLQGWSVFAVTPLITSRNPPPDLMQQCVGGDLSEVGDYRSVVVLVAPQGAGRGDAHTLHRDAESAGDSLQGGFVRHLPQCRAVVVQDLPNQLPA